MKKIPTTVEIVVAIITGAIISDAPAACTPARRPIAVTGITVIDVVAIASSITCASVAMRLVGFRVCSSCIAFSPKGVAALPIPKRLAAK